MSSLIVFSDYNGLYIGTDTISHIKKGDKMVPYTFISKTIYLPQFKCCVAVQGFANLIDQFFSFTMRKVVAYDASSFFECCKKYFFDYLNFKDYNQDHIGTIFIIGYSIEMKSMQTYKLTVTKQGIEFESLGNCSYIKPMISNFEEVKQKVAELKDDHYTYHMALITEIMKEQLKEDLALSIEERVGIGGQIQFTYMPLVGQDGNPQYLIEIAHTFDNYFSDYETMLGQTAERK